MNPSQQTSLQVLDTLDLMVRLWNIGNIPALISHADKECSGFGLWPGDHFRNIDEFQAFLERWTVRVEELDLSDVHVEAIGTISWITGSFIISLHEKRTCPEGRFTAVLKGTGHAWVLVHLHLSFPSSD